MTQADRARGFMAEYTTLCEKWGAYIEATPSGQQLVKIPQDPKLVIPEFFYVGEISGGQPTENQ